jgi:hypothetical protein
LAHAATAPPNDPLSSPSSYDIFVTRRTCTIQQAIGQAIGNKRIMNPSLMFRSHKKDFNIQLDSSIAPKHGENDSRMTGIDIQTIGKQLAYVVRGETKFKNFKRNQTCASISVTFLGGNVYFVFKVVDQIVLEKFSN